MSPSSPASWGALQGSVKSARPEHIKKWQQRCRSSVTKSPVYRRARLSRRAYDKNFLSNAQFFVPFARLFVILCIFRALIKLFDKPVNNFLKRRQKHRNLSFARLMPVFLLKKRPSVAQVFFTKKSLSEELVSCK